MPPKGVFRCGACRISVSPDAPQCPACGFEFGSIKSTLKARPPLVVMTQVVALMFCFVSAVALIPAFIAGLAFGGRFSGDPNYVPPGLILAIALSIPAASFLVFWGLIKPRGWARSAAITFVLALCVLATVAAVVLSGANASSGAVLAGLTAVVLMWCAVALWRSRSVRKFVADGNAGDGI